MNSSNYIHTIYNQEFITRRADPHVYRHTDGKYYFTASVPTYDRIVLRESLTLDGLKQAQEKTIWHRHEKGIMSAHIWAPEIHFMEGNCYLYYAGGDVDDIWAIRPYVMMCRGQNPMEDEWVELGMLKPADDFTFQDFSLDMTVFSNRGRCYCVWAEKVNVGKKISNLYIAEMKSPCELATPQVLLSSPCYDWEKVGFWVNEAPAVIIHAGKLYLTYSASATGECYCVGMLSIAADGNLLDPYEWKKEKEPVLKSDSGKGLFGPGHNSFTKSEDGTEDVMFYHARQYDEIEGDPLYDGNRHTYRMKIKWDAEDRPIFDFANNF